MTVRERAGALASVGAADQEALAALLERAIREDLRDVAETLETSASHKEVIYAGLGMNGEDQARPIREIAWSIRRRSEL